MGFNPNIRKTINQLAGKKLAELEEMQIYMSPQMGKYLSGLSGTLQGDHKKALKVEVIAGEKNGMTAMTDGDDIFINWQNELFSRYSTPESRFDAFLGGFYHEMSHVLFYDFNSYRIATRVIENGHFYGEEPVPENQEEETNLQELITAMNNPAYGRIFFRVWKDLDNILSDRHDEDAMIDSFGKLVKSGIFKIRESLSSYLSPFEELIALINQGKTDKLTAAYDAVLQLSRFGSVFMFNDSLWHSNEILRSLKQCAVVIEDAVCEDSLEKRYGFMNRIVLYLWPYIRELLEKAKSEGKNDPESANDVMDALKAAQQVPQSEHARNRKGSGTAKSAVGMTSGQNSGSAPTDENAGSNSILEGIKKDLAQDLAENEVEQQMAEDLLAQVKTVDMNSTHKNIKVDYRRTLDERAPDRCEEISQEIRPYTKHLISEMNKALADLQEGGLNKHRQFGRILIPNDTYRPDGRYYAKKNLPKDLPDMAISILVDNSGSMCGPRIDTARKAALLVYDFATELHIPVCVSGHTTKGKGVIFQIFSDYEKITGRDRERIAAMEAMNCNRDGMAIEIAANLLNRRPEAYKLLLIISDGQPNHHDYGGEAAAADIQSVIRRYRRQGIEIIAAAIGDDKELIEDIYTDGFIDISCLEKLPKVMAKVIRQRILYQMG